LSPGSVVILSANSIVTNAINTSIGAFPVQIAPALYPFYFTSTYTSAQTNVVLVSETGSKAAIHITDIIFSNNSTQGNMSLIESRPNAAIKVKIAPLYLMPYGGAVLNFTTPLRLDTNSSLCMTSQTVTAHSITVIGYSA
jgi:hypothetical protein